MKFYSKQISRLVVISIIVLSIINLGYTIKVLQNDGSGHSAMQRHGILSEEDINNFSRGIVSVTSKVDVPFVGETDATVNALGFIISVEKGLIVVPKKVARMGPSVITIITHDKKECPGTVIYSDMIYQFGIIMMDKQFLSDNKDSLASIPLGSTRSRFSAGDQDALVGRFNQELVVKNGHLINTVRNLGIRYGSIFQSSFDNTANLAGAPIFNDQKRCVGMHFLSNESSSYGLKIEYIKHFLSYYLDEKFDGKPFSRADIGLNISFMVVGFAKTNSNFPDEPAEEVIKLQESSGGPPELMIVSQVIPGFEADGKIKPGDAIYKVDGRIVANDLILYDEILTSLKNKPVDLIVYRGGQEVKVTISKVEDTDNFRIFQYIWFAGCYFHPITPYVRASIFTNRQGIYMTYCSSSSPFSELSSQSNEVKNNYILEAIDSNEIKSLDNFIEFFKKNCSEQTIEVRGVDLNILGGTDSETPIDLPFTSQLIRLYSFSHYGGWTTQSIDLNEYCKGRTREFINKPDDPLYEQTVDNNPSTAQGNTQPPKDEKKDVILTQPKQRENILVGRRNNSSGNNENKRKSEKPLSVAKQYQESNIKDHTFRIIKFRN